MLLRYPFFWDKTSRNWVTGSRLSLNVGEHTLRILLFLRIKRWNVYQTFLYFVDSVSRYKFLVITNLTHFFMYLFISCLYMFRTPQRSSSGDRIVLIYHLV